MSQFITLNTLVKIDTVLEDLDRFESVYKESLSDVESDELFQTILDLRQSKRISEELFTKYQTEE